MAVTITLTFEKKHFIIIGIIIAIPLLLMAASMIMAADPPSTLIDPVSRLWVNTNVDMQGTNISDASSIGIGEDDPKRPLHISKIQDANIRLEDSEGKDPAAYIEFYNSTTRYGWIGLPGAEFLEIATVNGKNIILSPSGNIGIRTNNPLYTLDIQGDIRWTGTLKGGSVPWEQITRRPDITASGGLSGGGILGEGITISVADGGITSEKIKDGTVTSVDTDPESIQARVIDRCEEGSSIRSIDSDGSVTCEKDDAGENQWASSGDDIYTSGTGNVGIGTKSPAQKLTVDGNIEADDIYIKSIGKWASEITSSNSVNDLYGNFHSSAQCRFLDGTAILQYPDTICRFNSAVCPTGWYQYKSYTTTEENVCSSWCWGVKRECITEKHPWSDTNAIETCTYYTSGPSAKSCIEQTCSAARTQIGCF